MKTIKIEKENKEEKVIDDGTQCVCGKCEIEEHPCPFNMELNNDYELCNCCEYCSNKCALEI